MEVDSRLQALIELFDRLLLVLARPVVQRQLLAFIIVFFLAWAIPALLERFVAGMVTARGPAREAEKRRRGLPYRVLRIARAVEFTFFPLLGLLFSELAIRYFEIQGWHSGLIKNLRPVFWLLLIYRVLVGVLYAVFTDKTARLYSRRVLAPLFVLMVLVSIDRSLAGTFPLGEIELLRILDTSVTLRALLAAAVILYFFFVFAWIARDLLERYVLSRANRENGVANAVVISSYYSVLALGFLTAVSILGFDLSTLTIVAGGLSIGISFGLQELVANFVSGILLVFEQSLRPGDVIQVAGTSGTVSEVRLRSTVLKTVDNIEIFVPNKTLLTSAVETFTHSDRTVRRTVNVGVSYACQPEEVRTILIDIAGRHGLVLKKPPPSVFFAEFGESSLQFQLNFWIDEPPRAAETMSDLRFMIFREFKRHGIEIPFPQRDLYIHTMPGLSPTREL